jgi:tyrosyl-tRNA synthetase
VNVDDRDAAVYLRWFTLFDRAEIERLEAAIATRPEAREAQRSLAFDVTARTHGREAAERARAASEAAFAREPIRDPAVLEILFDELERFEFGDGDVAAGAGPLAVTIGAFSSNGDARRQIANGALTINGERMAAFDNPVPEPIDGRWLVVRVGRRNLRIGRRR